MRLIYILNKIANGELKEGTKFIYRNNVYKWQDNMILNTSNLEPFDIADRSDLNMELELIEPDDFADVGKMAETNQFREDTKMIEPKECEHEWEEYGMYNTKTKEDKHFRKCIKCDLEEEIEPTDNTKIEELDKYSCGMRNEYNSEGEVYARGFDLGAFGEDIIDKLNEVIRVLNKRS